jgi:hypothetical protein
MVRSLGNKSLPADFVNTLAYYSVRLGRLRMFGKCPVRKSVETNHNRRTAVLIVATGDQVFDLGALVETP